MHLGPVSLKCPKLPIWLPKETPPIDMQWSMSETKWPSALPHLQYLDQHHTMGHQLSVDCIVTMHHKSVWDNILCANEFVHVAWYILGHHHGSNMKDFDTPQPISWSMLKHPLEVKIDCQVLHNLYDLKGTDLFTCHVNCTMSFVTAALIIC